jgi:LysR family pca operon transcriptional activator
MPALDRLKLRHLQCLVAVAEHGSLVRAAAAMSVTQPAVSKMLAQLEDIVGQRLVERTNKGVVLTAAGRMLLRHAGSGLRMLRDGLERIARDHDAAQAPAWRLGALPNVAATVLPSALLRCVESFPHARLRIRSGSNAQLIGLLRQGELDLVVGRLAEPGDMAGLSFEQLYTEILVFAVRNGHPLARRRRLAPAELAGCRLLLPDAGTRVREAADRWFITAGLGLPDPPLETIDVSFGRSCVQQSDTVWCVPLGVVAHDLAQGHLQRLKIDTASTAGPVGLTLRAGHAEAAALQPLLDEIRLSAAQQA